MEKYLRSRNMYTVYDGLYDSLSLGIQQFNQSPVGPPSEFPFRSFAVINNAEDDNVLGTPSCINAVCTTDVFGTRIKYVNDFSDFAGHFWKMNEQYDARFGELVLTYSGVVPSQFMIELKDANEQSLGVFPVTTLPGTGVRTQTISLGSNAALANTKMVLLITDPSVTGANADFFVHQITFRQFPSQVQPIFSPVVVTNFGDNSELLNFNVLQLQSQGRLAFGSVEFSAPQDFTIANRVFGFKTNYNLDYFRIELEDEEGKKRSGYITGINIGANYYEFLKEFVPAGIDLTKIKKINILIDETALEPDNTPIDNLTVETTVA